MNATWITGRKPHFSSPEGQRLLRDKLKQWERVEPSEPCEVGELHVCSHGWCETRRERWT